MVVGVVRDREAGLRDPPPGRRVLADRLADREEGRVHVPVLEDPEDLSERPRAPAVVEGQGHDLLVARPVVRDRRRDGPARAELAERLRASGPPRRWVREHVGHRAHRGLAALRCAGRLRRHVERALGDSGGRRKPGDREHRGQDQHAEADRADDRGLRKSPERQAGRWDQREGHSGTNDRCLQIYTPGPSLSVPSDGQGLHGTLVHAGILPRGIDKTLVKRGFRG